MAEYRRDVFSGNWVLLAPERADRPHEFIANSARPIGRCPFCRGNEDLTPVTVSSYPLPLGAEETGNWQVRVIANKYPAVVESAWSESMAGRESSEFADARPNFGFHEVIVEAPQHASSLAEVTEEQAFWSFVAYRDRLQHFASYPRLAYALLFKNCRERGGATLEHAHSQIVASPRVPTVVQNELGISRQFHGRSGNCLYCEYLRQEMEIDGRIIAATSRFVALCPFASRFSYEAWVFPRQHMVRFERANLEELRELSQLFQQLLRALERKLPQAPYNYWIHTSPFDTSPYDYYHWHIELIPRISTPGGLEWGAGCFVNPVTPEDAASSLRKVMN